MTPIDDLNVGDMVAVVAFKGPSQWRTKGDFSGQPHMIRAISLPFLAVFDGEAMRSLDVRQWSVKKLSDDYVAAMMGEDIEKPQQEVDPMTCIRCGDRFAEKLAKIGKRHHWRWWCRTCHKDAGLAKFKPKQE